VTGRSADRFCPKEADGWWVHSSVFEKYFHCKVDLWRVFIPLPIWQDIYTGSFELSSIKKDVIKKMKEAPGPKNIFYSAEEGFNEIELGEDGEFYKQYFDMEE